MIAQNLVIEGDNFDALRYLRMTHANRIKRVYIDPPYNTGTLKLLALGNADDFRKYLPMAFVWDDSACLNI